MENTELETLRKCQLGILERLHSFCHLHGLRYSLSSGTMLGAVRHKGFIPWDDDVDIMMPRPDYDKFISMTLNGFVDGYAVVSAYNTPHYYLPFAKVIDENTTLIELKASKGCVLGAFVDVFPLDAVPEDEKERKILYASYRKQLRRMGIVTLDFGWHESGVKAWIKGKLYRNVFGWKGRELFLRSEGLVKSVPYDKTRRVCLYCSDYGEREIYPKAMFEEYARTDFEGLQLDCLRDSDTYLSQLYGDYMQLPPEEERVSHHFCYFYDWHRRWSMDELKSKGII